METFAQTIAEWHDFYLMLGTAAATLVGLLFVGLTLNVDLIRRADFFDVQHLAALTFNSFFYAVVFAIVFLIRSKTRRVWVCRCWRLAAWAC
jgi:hypothetical protein